MVAGRQTEWEDAAERGGREGARERPLLASSPAQVAFAEYEEHEHEVGADAQAAQREDDGRLGGATRPFTCDSLLRSEPATPIGCRFMAEACRRHASVR